MQESSKLKEAYAAMGEVFGYSKAGTQKRAAMHLANALIDNGDINRLSDLKEFYFLYESPVEENYWGVWSWYRDFRISPLDEVVYIAYRAIMDEEGLKGRLNIRNFASRGESLWKRLCEWSGDSATDKSEILIDYCRCVIREAKSFSSVVAYKAKATLDEYGWGVWEEGISKLGGKSSYLKPSPKEVKASAEERYMLAAIQEVRQKHLDALEVKEFDKIGKNLSRRGVRDTFNWLRLK